MSVSTAGRVTAHRDVTYQARGCALALGGWGRGIVQGGRVLDPSMSFFHTYNIKEQYIDEEC